MTSITGDQVWEAFQRAPQYNPNDPTFAVLESFVRQLPDTLADILSSKMSIEALLKAKIAFAQSLLDSEELENFANGLPDALFAFIERDELIDFLVSGLQELQEMAEETLEDLPELLQDSGMTDVEVLFAQGLDYNLRERALEGKLTLGEVLASQPDLIVLQQS